MKLVLGSEGFSTPNMVEVCVKLVGKPQDQITVGIVNEAYAAEEGSKRWVIDNLKSVADNFGAEIDIVDLLALPLDEVEARLAAMDVIFVIGGETDYLMSVYRKTGFDKLLPKILKSKVYVGSSAGSIVMGRRLSSQARKKILGGEDKLGITDYLGLVDLAIVPHMGSPDFPDNRPVVLQEMCAGLGFDTYGLRDDSAVIVDEGKVYTIGSEPVVIEKGGVKQ